MNEKTAQQPETDYAAMHDDEYAGQGGSYEIRDGKRVLLHRTKSEAEARAEEEQQARG